MCRRSERPYSGYGRLGWREQGVWFPCMHNMAMQRRDEWCDSHTYICICLLATHTDTETDRERITDLSAF